MLISIEPEAIGLGAEAGTTTCFARTWPGSAFAADRPIARPPLDPRKPRGARTTNRRAYDGRAVAPEVLARLADSTPGGNGVATHWVVRAPTASTPLAATIGRADAVMFGEPTMRRAFLGNVRFDRPPGEAVDEGLSLGSLELTAADRVALRVMCRVPDAVLKLGRASAVFAGKARQLVVSSSGLLVVVRAPTGC